MHTAPNLSTPSARQLKAERLLDPNYRVCFTMVTILFFLWALPNNLNDILIRQFMKSFQISRLQAGLVQSAFYLGYFLFSMPAALILRRFGYRIGLVSGLLLYSVGAFLFWPAAYIGRYSCFLFALFVIAAGLAFLETGAGSFITQLGDPATSERRLNLAQAFNPPGTIAGALIGTIFILSGVEPTQKQISAMSAAGQYQAFLHHETMRVIAPYLILSGVIFLFAIVLSLIRFPAKTSSRQGMLATKRGSLRQLLSYPHFRKAVVAQFFYVGAQVGTWSYLIQYTQDYTHQPEKVAGYFLSSALIFFALGRFVSTYLMKFFKPNKLMGTFAVFSAAFTLMAILFPGWLGLIALLCVSFFMSLMYPTIFALGLKRLGVNTTLGASLIVMAIIGGAVITPLIGWIAVSTHSMAMALYVVFGCFLVVAHFGFLGSRVRNEDFGSLCADPD
jgi:FHS family L-fucose permease-like MFS transporter